MLPQPSLPISQPVKSAKYAEVNSQGNFYEMIVIIYLICLMTRKGSIIIFNFCTFPGIIDTSSPMSGGATNKDTSSTPNSTDNGSVVQQPQVHAKHDILVWFEVLELGRLHSFNITIISLFVETNYHCLKPNA